MSDEADSEDDLSPDDWNPWLEPRDTVPEDVELGLRFVHQVEMETKQHLAELSASFYALVESFIARGILAVDDMERRRQTTLQREIQRLRSGSLVVLYDVPDKYSLTDLPEIDCQARLPLCQARCCGINFALSTQDLDERVVRWDYSRPYRIAKSPDGYCVHSDADTRECTVYAARPGFCRTYDCRQDRRIWIDFEKRIPVPLEGDEEPAGAGGGGGEAAATGTAVAEASPTTTADTAATPDATSPLDIEEAAAGARTVGEGPDEA